jgi:protein-tyrosine-phosphatase
MPEGSAKKADKPATYNILFVCTGNTCRSPLAEAITRQRLAERGWNHVRVDSAGAAAAWGAPASEGSLGAAAAVGLDLEGHRSQPLTARLVEESDIILAMTTGRRMASRSGIPSGGRRRSTPRSAIGSRRRFRACWIACLPFSHREPHVQA